MENKPQRTFIVHGEEEPALALRDNLQKKLGFGAIDIPDMHQTFTL